MTTIDNFDFTESLNFDQQIYGAKALMILHQSKSLFYIAQGYAGNTLYTCWRGSDDGQPYAIQVSVAGKSTGPTVDGSKIAGCVAWDYPPQFSCAAAVKAMLEAGISQPWQQCRLSMSPGNSPMYTFSFEQRNQVLVNATTGQVTEL